MGIYIPIFRVDAVHHGRKPPHALLSRWRGCKVGRSQGTWLIGVPFSVTGP
jgi:hypothetical protein